MTSESRGVVTAPNAGVGLQMDWPRFGFDGVPPHDGIGKLGNAEQHGESALALGTLDDMGRHTVHGTGFMVAPGLIITATHVVEDSLLRSPIAMAYLPGNSLRLWRPIAYVAYKDVLPSPIVGMERVRRDDVCLVSCELISEPAISHSLLMAPLEVAVPRVGERLWAMGHRQTSPEHETIPAVVLLGTTGIVTDLYLSGRGVHMPGPHVAVDMETEGGMSGGPVFNSAGNVIGIVSSSHSGEKKSPTFVSLVWPALTLAFEPPWPPGLWRHLLASEIPALELARRRGHASILGNVQIDEAGALVAHMPSL